MNEKQILIYDTTLRDGAQTVGISFSLNDKINIAKALDRLKVDFIEGGWPGSNPKDDLFFRQIREEGITHSKIAAFGSTKRHGVAVKDDALVQALVDSKADVLTLVAKTWDFHVTRALGITLEENLALIYETVSYLKDKGYRVFLDGEHFFDGFNAMPDYSLRCVAKAFEAGADMFVLCDTNGGMLPHMVYDITKKVKESFDKPLGVHVHNDTGVAIANSISAVMAGATSVQGTINGYGERCGNCDLTALIPNIVLKMGYKCSASDTLNHLTEISRFVSETANFAHNERLPYVGDNAFAHKGGIHVSAIQKDSKTYEHIDPALVGNRRKVTVSELSGKSNIEFKAKELGIDLNSNLSFSKDVLKRIKTLEDQGFQFEGAEGSFELIIRESTGEYKPFFELLGFRVITDMNEKEEMSCEATIKVRVNGEEEHTAANGNGPVAAMDNALRKALTKFYPDISNMQLFDYKVRVLNEKDGTDANVRVLIDHKMGTEHWGTVGVSSNILQASWQALVDGIEYMLFKNRRDS